jgi:hypothetical protein
MSNEIASSASGLGAESTAESDGRISKAEAVAKMPTPGELQLMNEVASLLDGGGRGTFLLSSK